MPQCRECGDELNDDNWYPSQKKINSRICKKCMSQWGAMRYAKNPEKVKARANAHYAKNKTAINEEKRNRWKTDEEYRETGLAQGAEYYQKVKTEVISHYSRGTMACADPHGIHEAPFIILDALSIDHPLNNGAEERLKLFGDARIGSKRFYVWLKKQGYPEGYRVLCMTCQMMNEIQRQRAIRKPNTRYSKYRAKLKLEVLGHYSARNLPQCADPHHIHVTPFTLLDGLSLEHINGGGTQHYRRLGLGSSGMYQWLKKNGYPEGYSVLCFNCQFITASKRRYTHTQQELKR